MTASAFSLSEMYAGANFELLTGAPVQGGMKASPVHYVCPECSSWVYTKVSSTIGDFINVRATMFDDGQCCSIVFDEVRCFSMLFGAV